MLLSVREVAKILRCHENTVRNYARDGVLKSVRIGKPGGKKTVKFHKSEVDKLTKQGE
jgi:excisionase family DNA binding protein